MISSITTSSDAFFSQTTRLDGVDYILRFVFNQRENCYYLSIQDPLTGSDILSGIKVVSNFGLLSRFNGYPGLPPGELVAWSNTSDKNPAGLGELGENARVTLLYFDAEEIGNV